MMPGLGATPHIFDKLDIPSEYQVIYLHWLMPEKDESLQNYVRRLIETQVKETTSPPILLGMSFGGIIINEMAKQISVQALVFISTAKSYRELPPKYTLGRWLKIYKWTPFGWLKDPTKLKPLLPFKKLKKRLDIYNYYLERREAYYFEWSVYQVLHWKGTLPKVPFLHISGDKDTMFPIKYLEPPFKVIPGGTHMAILTHTRQINTYLKPFLQDLLQFSKSDDPIYAK